MGTCKNSNTAENYAASFYVWETVSFPIQLLDSDGNPSDALVDSEKVMVSIRQGTQQINIANPAINVESGTITLKLTQEQTGSFKPGDVLLQVNIYYRDTERDVSSQATLRALDNLYKQVMP